MLPNVVVSFDPFGKSSGAFFPYKAHAKIIPPSIYTSTLTFIYYPDSCETGHNLLPDTAVPLYKKPMREPDFFRHVMAIIEGIQLHTVDVQICQFHVHSAMKVFS